MKASDITHYRLYNQLIAHCRFKKPREVVSHMGAMQAQDYVGSLWAVGLRTPGSTQHSIEQAIADGDIIRTWPMRGTLHVVEASDAAWMLNLLTPRVIARSAYRYKQLDLTNTILKRSRELFMEALEGGKHATRKEMYAILQKGGIDTHGQRGIHILGHIAQEQGICLGPREGKQTTFVLFHEWVKKGRALDREESLAELARRYFTGHGPALLKDFVWWSGLTVMDAKRAIELASDLESIRIDQETYWMGVHSVMKINKASLYLLPAFDEYMVAYKDRSAVLNTLHTHHINPGNNGMLNPVIVVGGQVIGTWKRVVKKDSVHVSPRFFTDVSSAMIKRVDEVVGQYGTFLGVSGMVRK